MEPTSRAWRSLWERLGAELPVVGEEQQQLRRLPNQLAERAADGEELALAQCDAALWRLRYQRVTQQGAETTTQGRTRTLVGGSKEEQWHAEQVSELIGRTADQSPEVREFRSWLLGQSDAKPLRPAAARALLHSPLLRFAMMEDIVAWGIPLLGHKARLLSDRVTISAGARSDGAEAKQMRVATILVSWAQNRRTLTFGRPVSNHEQHCIEYANAHGRAVSVEIELFSVLGMIQWHAKRLTESAAPCAPWWMTRAGAAPSAVWYLLTGSVPKIPVIQARWEVPGSGADAITITALAHAKPESVKDAFAQAQRGQGEGRVPPPRRAALLPFVLNRSGDRPSWPKLCRDWNALAPARWRYQSWRNMCRDFETERSRRSKGTFGDLTYAERLLVVVEAELRAREKPPKVNSKTGAGSSRRSSRARVQPPPVPSRGPH